MKTEQVDKVPLAGLVSPGSVVVMEEEDEEDPVVTEGEAMPAMVAMVATMRVEGKEAKEEEVVMVAMVGKAMEGPVVMEGMVCMKEKASGVVVVIEGEAVECLVVMEEGVMAATAAMVVTEEAQGAEGAKEAKEVEAKEAEEEADGAEEPSRRMLVVVSAGTTLIEGRAIAVAKWGIGKMLVI
ncbi:hypothetical protein PT974_10777 [Cladobotryum mycophilum]|uniref:Uncharacterized protein n=1 Tax=Cladobotryum mycophilum TaxID=491253 RepID=A0ABR0SBS0_9HYPO